MAARVARMAASMAAALLAMLLLAGGAQAAAPRANDGDWLAYGHDGRLDNAVVSPTFRPSTVPNLHERWRAQLGGTVVASPLFAGGVLYVATQGGSVYALAAADGHVLWQQTTGTTLACGGFPFGISSTGAIDRARGLLYEIGADGKLHAFGLATGAEAANFPVDLIPSPATQYVWGGLRIVGERLYVPFASYCDEIQPGDTLADGGIYGVDLASPATHTTFDAVPGDGNGGGVWGYGGVSAELDGSFLYAGVGNSHVFDEACGCDLDNIPYGDPPLKPTPDPRGAHSDYPPGINPQGGGAEGLYALDGRTGATLWSAPTDGETTYSPLIEARRTLFAPIGDGIRAYWLEP